MNTARTERLLTAKAVTEQVADDVRRIFRDALDATGVSAALVAAHIGRDASLVEEWSRSKHAPLYSLFHSRVPLALRLCLIGAATTAIQACVPRLEITPATANLVRLAGEFLAAAGAALLNGDVDSHERQQLSKHVEALGEACMRWRALPANDGSK